MAFADDVKSYCHAEEDVTAFVNAAESYLKNAGIAINESDALYGLAVKMLVSHWYDNREPVGTASKMEYGLAGIIAQLQNQAVA